VAERPKVTCLVTIHGIGFQQPADDANRIPGYADDLHRALKAQLPRGYLSDDPYRQIGGAVYVRSDPYSDNDRAEGLKRLGRPRDDGTTDPTGADLIKAGQDGARLAHVALVYCNSEDWQRLHIGSAADGAARSVIAGGRYLSVLTSPRWLFRIVRGLRFGSRTPSASLQRRGDLKKTPSGGVSGLGAVLWGLINDTCAYVCENQLRSRVRGFVWEALVRLATRDDVNAVVINAHSQGTVVALDALSGLELHVGQKVKGLITAGSPLRKYVDLFSWGDRLNRPGRLPWLEADGWLNFWDPADPAADPLRPPPTWKAGAKPEAKDGIPTLFRSVDPDRGDPWNVVVTDLPVQNTKWSKGGGLRAHNYWDNEHDFVPQVRDFLMRLGATPPPPPAASSRRPRLEPTPPVLVRTDSANQGGQTMNNSPSGVLFPATVQDPKGDDLSQPVTQLLRDLSMLGTPTEIESANGVKAAFTGPPQSVAIIEAGATALGKWWTAALASGASLTAIIAAIQGIWGGEHDPVRVAFVAGAAVVVAALAIAIGIIVSSDVRGRAAGAAAQIQARANIATTFLALSRPTVHLSSDQAIPNVTDVRLDSEGRFQAKVGGAWIGLRQVDVASTKP